MKVANIDKSNMKKVISDFPKQLEEALEFAKDVKIEGDFKNVVVCGMGGSAWYVNILLCWLENIKAKTLPIYIHRDYLLPNFASKDSLIICSSYSGNTEETVSALKEAIKNNFKTVVMASGGKVEKICQDSAVPFVKLPSGIQPRSATGYMLAALFKILANSGLIQDKSEEILETAKKLRKINEEQERLGKDLAKKLVNKIPLVYASSRFKCLARIWKIKFNENSKTPAFYNYFPELNHNEMVGFTNKKATKFFHIIIIKDKEDYPRNQERMELFSETMKEREIGVDFVEIREGSALFKIFSTLLLGDWTSYHLALELKEDPTPVKMVEDFKKKLKE